MGSIPTASPALPQGAWDSHLHVVDEDVFPLHPDHPYRPKKANLDELQRFHSQLGIAHPCLVAFSVYGDDNRSIVDALGRLKGKGRAVACIDPRTVSDEELKMLHEAGVRGIRLNLKTTGKALDVDVVKASADRIRPFGWALQLYIALHQVVELAPLVPDLGVAVILDHVGSPSVSSGPGKLQTGYKQYLSLLQSGRVWTKLSGTYRFPTVPDLDEYIVDVLRTAPDRVVWASDWPHSSGPAANPGGDRNKPQDYRNVDDRAWMAKCWDYCREAGGGDGLELARKIWVDNPRKLWQYEGDD